MVSQCKQKWERKYEDVVEEKDEVTRKLTALNEKVERSSKMNFNNVMI